MVRAELTEIIYPPVKFSVRVVNGSLEDNGFFDTNTSDARIREFVAWCVGKSHVSPEPIPWHKRLDSSINIQWEKPVQWTSISTEEAAALVDQIKQMRDHLKLHQGK